MATINFQKYRQIHTALEHAEERADEAENNLIRVRSKIRSNSLGISASSANVNSFIHNGEPLHFKKATC